MLAVARLFLDIYVVRKQWIWTIHGLRSTKYGSVLCATIHGLPTPCAIHGLRNPAHVRIKRSELEVVMVDRNIFGEEYITNSFVDREEGIKRQGEFLYSSQTICMRRMACRVYHAVCSQVCYDDQ